MRYATTTAELRAQNGCDRADGLDVSVARARLPKIGLALSAGGARGLAHVGVIQVLEKSGIPISAIAGTSMGAYVGALYAAGIDGRELESLAREIPDRRTLRGLLDYNIPPTAGLIKGHKIRRHLERTIGELTFEQLKRPLIIVAADLEALQAHVFQRGPVAAAVHASAAIPGICSPVTLAGRRYTDGGAVDPLPVTLLREHFDLDAVIAVNVLPTYEDLEQCQCTTFTPLIRKTSLISRLLQPVNLLADGNVLDTFRRALMAAQIGLVEKEARRADVLIHPYHSGSSWADFENHERYIRTGRLAAEAALPAIRALFSQHSTLANHENPHHKSTVGCLAA